MRLLLALGVLAACGNDPVHHLGDAACVQQVTDYTVALTTPAAYACHEPYKAKVVLSNDSCAPVTVADVKITGVVTSGPCTPPPVSTYPTTFTVAAHASNTVLDLTGGTFCCFQNACPTPFQCDEHYTIDIATPQGTITKTADVHLSLAGCDVICP